MSFSSEDDLDAEPIQFQQIEESIEEVENMNKGAAKYHQREHHKEELEFWPLEHPMEPSEDDRPVKCPMEDSSVINDHNQQYGDGSWRKRTDSWPFGGGRGIVVEVAEPQAVRKRQHTLAGRGGDHILSPLMGTPSAAPLETQNLTIFQMLQQLDDFKSESSYHL